MPTYDYKCAACGHLFEHFQALSDPHLKKCPECGKPKLERLIGAGGGLIFKGSGFYITDYRSNAYQEAAKKESGAPAGSEPSATAKSGDAKPADKAAGDGKSATAPAAGAKPAAPPPAATPSKSSGAAKGRKSKSS